MSLSSLFALVPAIGALLSVLLELLLKRRREQKEPQTIEARIAALSSALGEAASLVDQVEGEIRARSELADRLKKDIAKYEKIAAAKKGDVEAIAQVMRGELRREGTRSFWKGVAVNFVFFVLGGILSYVLTAASS